jgi:hypothetical protein
MIMEKTKGAFVPDPPGYMPYKNVVLEESSKHTRTSAQMQLYMKVGSQRHHINGI